MPITRTRSPSPDALYRPLPQEPETALSGQEVTSVEDVEDNQSWVTSSAGSVVDSKVVWIHFILGCTTLLPWNVAITAMPYFLKRFEGSGLENTFSSYLSTTFNTSIFIFLAHATLTSKRNSPSRRTRLSTYWLVFLTTSLVASTFFVLPSRFFFTFVLINCAAQAAASAYFRVAIVATASLFGPVAVQAMMAGQAAVAVAVSSVQVLSAAASIGGESNNVISDGSAEERSAFIFLSLSLLFLVGSNGAHSWLMSLPSCKAVAEALEQQAVRKEYDVGSDVAASQLLIPRGGSKADDERTQVLRVARTNILYEIAVGYVFLVTLAVFPPITTSILPVNPEVHPLLFTSIHFLVFNIGDFLGRYACSFPILLVWCRKRILGMSLARTFFIPLFLMCNVQRPSPIGTPASAPIINSDLMFMLILFIFGWTGGYVASLCMMAAPSIEHNQKLKGRVERVDVAATVANFSLTVGLMLGSITSFAVQSMICQCNPFTP